MKSSAEKVPWRLQQSREKREEGRGGERLVEDNNDWS